VSLNYRNTHNTYTVYNPMNTILTQLVPKTLLHALCVYKPYAWCCPLCYVFHCSNFYVGSKSFLFFIRIYPIYSHDQMSNLLECFDVLTAVWFTDVLCAIAVLWLLVM